MFTTCCISTHKSTLAMNHFYLWAFEKCLSGLYTCAHRHFSGSGCSFCTTAPHHEHVSYLCFPQWQNTVAEVCRHFDVWIETDTYSSGMDGFLSCSVFTLPLPQLTCVEWATYIRTTPVATSPATVNRTHPLGADVGNGKAKPRKWAHLLPRLTSHLHTKSLLSPVSFASRRLAPACPLCFAPCLSIPRSVL